MKWNVLFGTLVLGFGLCANSYGFELLDRMLGVGDGCSQKGGCDPKCGVDPKGCAQKDPKGCAQKDPKGCAQKDPKCGVDPKCDPKGDPKCGAAQKCGIGGQRGRLFDGLFGCGNCGNCGGKGGDPKCGDPKGCAQKDPKGCAQKDPKDPKGCAQKDPKCGVDPKCDPKSCAQKGTHRPLLDALFGCRTADCGKGGKGCEDPGCCDSGKEGGTNKAKASSDKDAPMPPAPVVDPSAFLNTRTVIPASRIVR